MFPIVCVNPVVICGPSSSRYRLHLVRRFCVFELGCVAWGVGGAVVGVVFVPPTALGATFWFVLVGFCRVGCRW